MLPLIQNVTSFLYSNIGCVLDLGMFMLTFIESYFIPIAIIKWIIIFTKFGNALPQIKKKESEKVLQSSYRYKLELTTSWHLMPGLQRVEQVSHVSMIIEGTFIQLSYCGQDCRRIPPALQKMYGAKVKCLDLSYNNIETLKGLDHFSRLEELILDNNKLSDVLTFPYLSTLRTLSLNNNEIVDLEELVNKISKNFPSLTYLSLLSNKACPNQLSDIDKDESDYQRYRYFVIFSLPSLKFLDSRRVSSEERREASVRGEFMRVRRPPSDVTDSTTSPIYQTRGAHLRPLPVDFTALGKHRSAYGRCNYKYTGKHSEGNRFIVNSDL